MVEMQHETQGVTGELGTEQLDTVSAGFCGFYSPTTTTSTSKPSTSEIVVTKSVDCSPPL
jgi:hypothetical protein